jgi:hypothetical protein
MFAPIWAAVLAVFQRFVYQSSVSFVEPLGKCANPETRFAGTGV